jgi:hypothetical protein
MNSTPSRISRLTFKKLKWITRVVGFGLTIIAAGVFLSGCAGIPYQAYSGPALSREKVAVIKSSGGLAIHTCDGVDYRKGECRDGIILLPGKHNFMFLGCGLGLRRDQWKWGLPHWEFVDTGGYCIEDLFVEAGKTYRAVGKLTPSGTLSTRGTLTVDIVEIK